MKMSDSLRVLNAPWSSTINKTNHGYDHWLTIYLMYVEVLND